MTLSDLLAMPSIEQIDYVKELSDAELDRLWTEGHKNGSIEAFSLMQRIEHELLERDYPDNNPEYTSYSVLYRGREYDDGPPF